MSKDKFEWTDDNVIEVMLGRWPSLSEAMNSLDNFKAWKASKQPKEPEYVMGVDPYGKLPFPELLKELYDYVNSPEYKKLEDEELAKHKAKIYKKSSQPKEPERIEVRGFNVGSQMNKPIGTHQYWLTVSDRISQEKFPAIKAAIESIVNNEHTVKPFGMEFKMIPKDYYDNLVNKKYTEKDLEDAFNAGRATDYHKCRLLHYNFKEYLNQLNSK